MSHLRNGIPHDTFHYNFLFALWNSDFGELDVPTKLGELKIDTDGIDEIKLI